jgi:hypothetical protein
VETVVGFLKQKLPAQMAGQLDSFLSNPAAAGGVADQLKGLAGKFGRK